MEGEKTACMPVKLGTEEKISPLIVREKKKKGRKPTG